MHIYTYVTFLSECIMKPSEEKLLVSYMAWYSVHNWIHYRRQTASSEGRVAAPAEDTNQQNAGKL